MTRDRALDPEMLGDLQEIQNRLTLLERAPRFRSAQIHFAHIGEFAGEGYSIGDPGFEWVNLWRGDCYVTAPVVDFDFFVRSDLGTGNSADVDVRLRVLDQTSASNEFVAAATYTAVANQTQIADLINLFNTFGPDIIGHRVRIDIEARWADGGGSGDIGVLFNRPSLMRAPRASDQYVSGVGLLPMETEYYEEFTSKVIPGEWTIEDGAGNDGWGVFSPGAISILKSAMAERGPNVCRITAQQDQLGEAGLVSGAFKLNQPVRYGQIEIRMRCSDDPSQVTSGRCVMFAEPDPVLFPPVDNPEGTFPAGGALEIVKSEDDRDTRTPAQTTINRLDPAATPPYVAADNEVVADVDLFGIDQSDFHTYLYTWLPGGVTIQVDDDDPIIVSADEAEIPDWLMDLHVRLDQLDSPSAPGQDPVLAGQVTLDIDYIHVRSFVTDPSPTKSVTFRTATSDPTNSVVSSDPTTIAATPGTTHLVSSESEWNTAVAAAGPGDIIRLTANIPAILQYRGARQINGPGTAADGTPDDPIIITCDPGVWIDPGDQANGQPALAIYGANHIWCIGVNVRNSQFGIYYRCCEGNATTVEFQVDVENGLVDKWIHVAHCTITDTGDAALTIAGWFATLTSPPSANPEDTHGYSRYFVVEANTISRPGRRLDQFGECFYAGNGSSPGWVGWASDILFRYNLCEEATADWTDVKPGCQRIYIVDNVFRNGGQVFGSGHSLLYVFAGLAARPSWYDLDPHIHFEGNRTYDISITTNPTGSSGYGMQMSICGVRVANNLFWSNGLSGSPMIRFRSEADVLEARSTANEQWIIWNNTLWHQLGYQNVGYGTPFIGAFPGTYFTFDNNLGPTGATGVEATTADSSFVGPVPAVNVLGTADAGDGVGSAFDWDSTSIAGTPQSSSELFIPEDIAQRGYPVTWAVGAIQEFVSA